MPRYLRSRSGLPTWWKCNRGGNPSPAPWPNFPDSTTARGNIPANQIIHLKVPGQDGTCLFSKRNQPGPGHPPGSCSITLTGKHIPDTLRRALQWSEKHHGITARPDLTC